LVVLFSSPGWCSCIADPASRDRLICWFREFRFLCWKEVEEKSILLERTNRLPVISRSAFPSHFGVFSWLFSMLKEVIYDLFLVTLSTFCRSLRREW
jgi:hypothetical protein